jgi:hypothetical protein
VVLFDETGLVAVTLAEVVLDAVVGEEVVDGDAEEVETNDPSGTTVTVSET